MQLKQIDFDQEVSGRVRLVCRWSRALRHELGNLLYPSAGLLRRVEGSGRDGAKLVRHVRLLTELLDESRAGLDLVRSPADAGAGGTDLAEMWGRIGPLIRSLLPEGSTVRLEGTDAGTAAPAPEAVVAMVLVALCVAAELLAAEGERVELRVRPLTGMNGGGGGLEVRLRGVWWAEPSVPELAEEFAMAAGGRLQSVLSESGEWVVEAAWPEGTGG